MATKKIKTRKTSGNGGKYTLGVVAAAAIIVPVALLVPSFGGYVGGETPPTHFVIDSQDDLIAHSEEREGEYDTVDEIEGRSFALADDSGFYLTPTALPGEISITPERAYEFAFVTDPLDGSLGIAVLQNSADFASEYNPDMPSKQVSVLAPAYDAATETYYLSSVILTPIENEYRLQSSQKVTITYSIEDEGYYLSGNVDGQELYLSGFDPTLQKGLLSPDDPYIFTFSPSEEIFSTELEFITASNSLNTPGYVNYVVDFDSVSPLENGIEEFEWTIDYTTEDGTSLSMEENSTAVYGEMNLYDDNGEYNEVLYENTVAKVTTTEDAGSFTFYIPFNPYTYIYSEKATLQSFDYSIQSTSPDAPANLIFNFDMREGKGEGTISNAEIMLFKENSEGEYEYYKTSNPVDIDPDNKEQIVFSNIGEDQKGNYKATLQVYYSDFDGDGTPDNHDDDDDGDGIPDGEDEPIVPQDVVKYTVPIFEDEIDDGAYDFELTW